MHHEQRVPTRDADSEGHDKLVKPVLPSRAFHLVVTEVHNVLARTYPRELDMILGAVPYLDIHRQEKLVAEEEGIDETRTRLSRPSGELVVRDVLLTRKQLDPQRHRLGRRNRRRIDTR